MSDWPVAMYLGLRRRQLLAVADGPAVVCDRQLSLFCHFGDHIRYYLRVTRFLQAVPIVALSPAVWLDREIRNEESVHQILPHIPHILICQALGFLHAFAVARVTVVSEIPDV